MTLVSHCLSPGYNIQCVADCADAAAGAGRGKSESDLPTSLSTLANPMLCTISERPQFELDLSMLIVVPPMESIATWLEFSIAAIVMQKGPIRNKFGERTKMLVIALALVD